MEIRLYVFPVLFHNGRHMYAIDRDMDFFCCNQVNAAVNAGAGIPARAFPAGISLDRNDVFCSVKIEVRRNVIFKRYISQKLFAQVMSVDPDFADHLHGVKLKHNVFALHIVRKRKRFAVPSRTPCKRPLRRPCLTVRKRLVNAPVMRKLHGIPFAAFGIIRPACRLV